MTTPQTVDGHTLLHVLGPAALDVTVHFADLGSSPWATHPESRTIWLHERLAPGRLHYHLAKASAALAGENGCEPGYGRPGRHLRAVRDP